MKKIVYMTLLIAALLLSGCTSNKQDTGSADNNGEGASSTAIPDLDEGEQVQDDNKILVQKGKQDYEIIIDEVAYTDERNEYEADQEKVLLITYTYKNNSDALLLIDDVRFQLISADESEIYQPYYLMDAMYAEPIENGQSATAQIAFGVPEEIHSFKLIYKDTYIDETAPWILDIVL